MKMRAAAAAALIGLAAVVMVPDAAAQVLRGTLLDEETGAGVPGTLVTLRPHGGGDPVGTLTDRDGRFTITAPAPGEYVVRAERIGFATTSLPALRLEAGEVRDLVLRVASAPIILDGVGAIATRRQRCALRPEEGTEAAILWEEARKALATTEWTEREAAFLFEHALYERQLDARTLQVLSAARRTERVRQTFHTLPVERLLEDGFVQRTDSVTDYFGPDAAVLLSDRFLEQHCLRVQDTDDGTGALVGLAFEPVGRRSGIRGTLWLERSTAELRHLEFTYPNPPVRVPSDDIGGRIEFARLPTGEWIIQRWWIRTPRIGIEQGRTAAGQQADRAVLVGLNEHGGEVLGVYARNGRPLYTALAGTTIGYDTPSLLTRAAGGAVTAGGTAETQPATRAAEDAGAAPVAEPEPRADRRSRPNPRMITAAEIVRAGGSDAFEVVQSLRPQWLRVRGQTTLRTSEVRGLRDETFDAMVQTPVVVYVEGHRVGGSEALRGIAVAQIREIRHVDSREAVQRWGSDHGNGAIVVLLRR
jgi:hypothetical protein